MRRLQDLWKKITRDAGSIPNLPSKFELPVLPQRPAPQQTQAEVELSERLLLFNLSKLHDDIGLQKQTINHTFQWAGAGLAALFGASLLFIERLGDPREFTGQEAIVVAGLFGLGIPGAALFGALAFQADLLQVNRLARLYRAYETALSERYFVHDRSGLPIPALFAESLSRFIGPRRRNHARGMVSRLGFFGFVAAGSVIVGAIALSAFFDEREYSYWWLWAGGFASILVWVVIALGYNRHTFPPTKYPMDNLSEARSFLGRPWWWTSAKQEEKYRGRRW